MSDQKDLSILQRKAGVGLTQPEGSGMTPAKAFRLAVSKATQVELGLATQVKSIKEEHHNHAQLLEALDDDALLLMLEGPQGSIGVAAIDITVISALIEVQTLGAVIAAEANKRPPTRTDSAMCEAVLDQILQRFEIFLTDTTAAPWATGFRFERQIRNVRLLGLALPDVTYRMFHLELDLADGAKVGKLHLILPAEGPNTAQSGSDAGSGWAQALEKNVGDSRVDISAILHRFQMTLVEVQALQSGSMINVPKPSIADVLLEGSDGVVAGNARLGQQNGHRALRLQADGAVHALGVDQLSELSTLNMTGGEPSSAVSQTGLEANAGVEMAMAPIDDAALPDMVQDQALEADNASPVDLENLPTMPMVDMPLDDLEPMPMAAMPMDI